MYSLDIMAIVLVSLKYVKCCLFTVFLPLALCCILLIIISKKLIEKRLVGGADIDIFICLLFILNVNFIDFVYILGILIFLFSLYDLFMKFVKKKKDRDTVIPFTPFIFLALVIEVVVLLF